MEQHHENPSQQYAGWKAPNPEQEEKLRAKIRTAELGAERSYGALAISEHNPDDTSLLRLAKIEALYQEATGGNDNMTPEQIEGVHQLVAHGKGEMHGSEQGADQRELGVAAIKNLAEEINKKQGSPETWLREAKIRLERTENPFFEGTAEVVRAEIKAFAKAAILGNDQDLEVGVEALKAAGGDATDFNSLLGRKKQEIERRKPRTNDDDRLEIKIEKILQEVHKYPGST